MAGLQLSGGLIMNKKAFNKENVTELFSQLKKVINRDLGPEYNEQIKNLSKKVYKDLDITEDKELALHVASNYIRNCL